MVVLDTWMMLDLIKDEVIAEQMDGMTAVAGVIACMFSSFLILQNARRFILGEELDFLDLLKPVFMVGLVCNFSMLVLAPIDAIINIVMGLIAGLFGNDTMSYVTEWRENLDAMMQLGADSADAVYQEEVSDLADQNIIVRFFGTGILALKKYIMSFTGAVSLTFSALVGGVLFIVVKMTIFIQQILSCMFYCLNSILGPLALAFSILPSFGSAFREWAGRQIQISLWIPLGFLILQLNIELTRAFIANGAEAGLTLGMDWMMICLQIATLCMIFCIPKAATWIMSIGSVSDMHRSMGGPLKMLAKGAVKI